MWQQLERALFYCLNFYLKGIAFITIAVKTIISFQLAPAQAQSSVIWSEHIGLKLSH